MDIDFSGRELLMQNTQRLPTVEHFKNMDAHAFFNFMDKEARDRGQGLVTLVDALKSALMDDVRIYFDPIIADVVVNLHKYDIPLMDQLIDPQFTFSQASGQEDVSSLGMNLEKAIQKARSEAKVRADESQHSKTVQDLFTQT